MAKTTKTKATHAKPPKADFRRSLNDWATTTRNALLDKVSTVQRSRLMTEFFIATVRSRLEPSLLPDNEDDLQDCFVD